MGPRLFFYVCHFLYSTKEVKILIKVITYDYLFITGRVFKIYLKKKKLILNIALTFFPCYYKRKFFHYNQLQTILYKNEPSDLSAVKVEC